MSVIGTKIVTCKCVLIDLFNGTLIRGYFHLHSAAPSPQGGQSSGGGEIKKTGKKHPLNCHTQIIPRWFFLNKWLCKALCMEIEMLSILMCFLVIYLHIKWTISLGKSIILLPLSKIFRISFSSIPLTAISFLNSSKTSASISTFTEKCHTQSRILPLRTQRNFWKQNKK